MRPPFDGFDFAQDLFRQEMIFAQDFLILARKAQFFAQDFLILARKAQFFAQGAYQDIRDRSKKPA